MVDKPDYIYFKVDRQLECLYLENPVTFLCHILSVHLAFRTGFRLTVCSMAIFGVKELALKLRLLVYSKCIMAHKFYGTYSSIMF